MTEKQIRRFWDKVDKSGDCWIWKGARLSMGTGVCERVDVNGVETCSPRCVAMLISGVVIENTLKVRSKCGVKLCCNPAHLFLTEKVKKREKADSNSIEVTEKLKKRFFKKVVKTDGCWEWNGGRKPTGYGFMRAETKRDDPVRFHAAHRVSYAIHVGGEMAGYVVCHKCDNPGCVNPDHLFLGTYADNARDMMRKGRDKCGSLNLDQVNEIRAIMGSDPRPRVVDVAARFGVTRFAIYQILSGRTWRTDRDVIRAPLGDDCPTKKLWRERKGIG